ncbi:MAG: hypothetical protein HON90_06570 [Halobacteriovoraceae bacterium]|jgi:hypothetical protein|nr:hypothetical protein [Halobacteriovoraceae bacterium]
MKRIYWCVNFIFLALLISFSIQAKNCVDEETLIDTMACTGEYPQIAQMLASEANSFKKMKRAYKALLFPRSVTNYHNIFKRNTNKALFGRCYSDSSEQKSEIQVNLNVIDEKLFLEIESEDLLLNVSDRLRTYISKATRAWLPPYNPQIRGLPINSGYVLSASKTLTIDTQVNTNMIDDIPATQRSYKVEVSYNRGQLLFRIKNTYSAERTIPANIFSLRFTDEIITESLSKTSYCVIVESE